MTNRTNIRVFFYYEKLSQHNNCFHDIGTNIQIFATTKGTKIRGFAIYIRTLPCQMGPIYVFGVFTMTNGNNNICFLPCHMGPTSDILPCQIGPT